MSTPSNSSYRCPSSGSNARSSTVYGRPYTMGVLNGVMVAMVLPSGHADQCSVGDRQFWASSYFLDLDLSPDSSVDNAATKASCGTSTRPMVFIRFLPSFCFSSSLRLRVMSPP